MDERSRPEGEQRPEPFSVLTAVELWTDPHIAGQMLDFHLDPETAAASRAHEFINRSAAWIARRFDLAPGRRVLDLGCGPGLYTSRLVASGAEVVGMDVSTSSLAWAWSHDTRSRYVQGNYVDGLPDGLFDLVTLIYCDFCALAPAPGLRCSAM